MKKTGRFLALLLALLMVLSVGSMAFADEGDVGADALAAASTPEPTTTTTAIDDNNTGIIDKTQLDNWMENFMVRHSISGDQQTVSVGFYYSGTGDSWYYDADVWMYSASLYKVPVSMLVAEKEAAGEITQDTSIEGGTIGYLESTALTYSNNTSGHALVDYMGGTYAGKCADVAVKYTTLPDSYFTDSNFKENSYYTARFMTQVMTTLLNDSTGYPHVVEYLLDAQPDEYFKKTVKDYDIAQKYGAYEEKNGTNNNHCAAIIYTPSPIVVVVMTKNVGDYEDCIGEIGKMLTDYSLELDSNLEAYTKSQQEAAKAQEEAEKAALAAETADAAAATTDADMSGQAVESTPAATETPAASTAKKGSSIILFAIGLLFIILVALVIVLIVEKIRRNRADRYDDYDDYDEDDEDEDEDDALGWKAHMRSEEKPAKKKKAAPAPVKSAKKAPAKRAPIYVEPEEYDDEEEDEPEAEPEVMSLEVEPEEPPVELRPLNRKKTAPVTRPVTRQPVVEPEDDFDFDEEPEEAEEDVEEAPIHHGFVNFTNLRKPSRAAREEEDEEPVMTIEAEPVEEEPTAEAPRGRHSAPAGSHAGSTGSTSQIDRSSYKPKH